MLQLKLVENTNSKVVYNYYPEGKESYGYVSLDKSSGDVLEVGIAENDVHDRYMHHAVSKVASFIENNNYPETEIVAWC